MTLKQPIPKRSEFATSPSGTCLPHLGYVIRLVRITRGLTQVNLSEKIGIGQSYIALIESGAKFPTLDVLERICLTLDLRMSDLFRECESITWCSPPDTE